MQTLDIQPLICHKLHMLEEGCAQEIAKSAAWGYCPACGRSTGHVLALKTEGQLKAPKQKVSTTAFSLRNVGLTTVSVELDMEMSMPGVKLATRQQRQITIAPTTPQGPGISRVEIEIPALERSARSLGTLLINHSTRRSKAMMNSGSPASPVWSV